MKSREDEYQLHKENLQHAYSRWSQKFPNLKFKGMLMNIDGTYEEIDINLDDKSFNEFLIIINCALLVFKPMISKIDELG